MCQKKSAGNTLFIFMRHFFDFLPYYLTNFALSFYKCLNSDFLPTSLINDDSFIFSIELQSTCPTVSIFYFEKDYINDEDLYSLDYF